MIRISLTTILFYFVSQSSSFAYLDPGTGSIIIQAILGFIAAAGATVTVYWKKFKEFFQKIFKSKKKVD